MQKLPVKRGLFLASTYRIDGIETALMVLVMESINLSPSGPPPTEYQKAEIKKSLGILIPLGVADPTVNGVAAHEGTTGYTTEVPPRRFHKIGQGNRDWIVEGAGIMFGPNSNFRFKGALETELQIKETSPIPGFRTIWFEDGQLKVGPLDET